MYKDYTRAQIMEGFGFREDQVPETLIIRGSWSYVKFLDMLSKYMTNVEQAPRNEFIRFGKYQGKNVAIAVAYGSCFAADVAMIFAIIGVKKFIVIGDTGGLQNEVELGDIILPSEIKREDGLIDYYLPDQKSVLADPELLSLLELKLKKENISYKIGKTVSDNSVFGQTSVMVDSWVSEGLLSIDLESAAVFAVGQERGIPAVSILAAADNLVRKTDIFNLSDEAKDKRLLSRDLINELAFYLVNNN